jgi:hypothetical protein
MIPEVYSDLLNHIIKSNLPLPSGCSKNTHQDIILLSLYFYGIDSEDKFAYLSKDNKLVEIDKGDLLK